MDERMKIIAGPCQHENLSESIDIAGYCKEVCEKYDIEYIFKASFDKANRTNADSERGVGLLLFLDDVMKMKREFQKTNNPFNDKPLVVCTDVHTTDEIRIINDNYCGVINVLQIPALLSRQTSIIEAASVRNRIVNVKKGQWMSPKDILGILSKTSKANEVWITERGTSFGYNKLIVDFAGVIEMLEMQEEHNFKLFFDGTHSVQNPGLDEQFVDNTNKITGLLRAAAAVGVDNFFIEVHPNPEMSPSDANNMIQLQQFDTVIEQILEVKYG